jgi:alcohol dehydrogenase (cytochrome c)
VLDRENGALLLAKPFVEKLTWASEIGKDGRPALVPGMGPSFEGTEACPSMDGASNWFSGAYNPATGLLYFQALEKCAIYVKRAEKWQAGRAYMGGMPLRVPGEKPQKFLRALDIQTGDIVWELPQNGPGSTWGGVLATASGLVFVAEDGGSFLAADAENGNPLWRFQANADWKASPMTYVFDGKQHIAIAAGSNILVFALNEEPSKNR